jgi:hypothetical protein
MEVRLQRVCSGYTWDLSFSQRCCRRFTSSGMWWCVRCCLVLWIVAVPSSWGSSKVLQPSQCSETPIVSASHHWRQGSSSRTLLFCYSANLFLVRASAWTLAISISFVVFHSTPRLVPRLGQARFLPDAVWFIVNRSLRRCLVWSSESVVK